MDTRKPAQSQGFAGFLLGQQGPRMITGTRLPQPGRHHGTLSKGR
jgi:hypothetical protein